MRDDGPTYRDVLGAIYELLNMGDMAKGQYFTPRGGPVGLHPATERAPPTVCYTGIELLPVLEDSSAPMLMTLRHTR